ncbi:hypothetical protein TNCV_2344831 [Trichonephila clavipes]|nr:hypothetical protein TNCV_2344831 [Trichonephila clavipes]
MKGRYRRLKGMGPGLRSRSTRGLLATDHVILNHGQVTWTTPELAPPLHKDAEIPPGPSVSRVYPFAPSLSR